MNNFKEIWGISEIYLTNPLAMSRFIKRDMRSHVSNLAINLIYYTMYWNHRSLSLPLCYHPAVELIAILSFLGYTTPYLIELITWRLSRKVTNQVPNYFLLTPNRNLSGFHVLYDCTGVTVWSRLTARLLHIRAPPKMLTQVAPAIREHKTSTHYGRHSLNLISINPQIGGQLCQMTVNNETQASQRHEKLLISMVLKLLNLTGRSSVCTARRSYWTPALESYDTSSIANGGHEMQNIALIWLKLSKMDTNQKSFIKHSISLKSRQPITPKQETIMKKNKITDSTEFLTFTKAYDGGYTDFLNIGGWQKSSPKFKKCKTVPELRAAMRSDKSGYFTRRHFDKLHDAHAFYFANKYLFVSESDEDE